MKKPFAKKSGVSPGTPVYVGIDRSHTFTLSAMVYDSAGMSESKLSRPEEAIELMAAKKNLWLHCDGVHDVAFIEKLGEVFSIHPLILEDIVNTRQRPKIEDYGDMIYFVMRTNQQSLESHHRSQQVSIILGKGFVLSFQEMEGNIFDPIAERIRQMKGRITVLGPDYLTYRLLDTILDGFINELEFVQTRIDQLEEDLIGRKPHFSEKLIYSLRQELIHLRKSIFPLREFAATFRNLENELLSSKIDFFLMDFGDHASRVVETVESFRDSLAELLQLYLTQTNNKINEVMKVLTIISAIFIPLSFIAGYYGMNIKVPEYQWDNSFFMVLIIMAAVAGVQLFIFKRKGWF